MTPEEKLLYEKAVVFIEKNMNNPDFISVLREHKIRVFPSSLSFIIKKLEEAGYTVSKTTINTSIPETQTVSTDKIKEDLKGISVKISSLINSCDLSIMNNILNIKFPEKSSYQKKQLLEDKDCLITIKEMVKNTFNIVDVTVE